MCACKSKFAIGLLRSSANHLVHLRHRGKPLSTSPELERSCACAKRFRHYRHTRSVMRRAQASASIAADRCRTRPAHFPERTDGTASAICPNRCGFAGFGARPQLFGAQHATHYGTGTVLHKSISVRSRHRRVAHEKNVLFAWPGHALGDRQGAHNRMHDRYCNAAPRIIARMFNYYLVIVSTRWPIPFARVCCGSVHCVL